MADFRFWGTIHQWGRKNSPSPCPPCRIPRRDAARWKRYAEIAKIQPQ